MLLAPSVLSADFGNLQRDVEMLNESDADWIHVDIMDGRFVPNISFGFPVLEAVKKHSRKPLDVHLMITEPEKYVEAFFKGGADRITVHIEACIHLHSVLQLIHKTGSKVGVAINPHTPVEALSEIIDVVDQVLLMSVNPGFGGQKFIDHSLEKTYNLKNVILKKNSKALIVIDGGINAENALLLQEKGADVLVAGNFIFSSPNAKKTIEELKKSLVDNNEG